MPIVRKPCPRCGKPVEMEGSEQFVNSAVFAYCQECAVQEHVEYGGRIMQIKEQIEGARFSLGPIVINPGAVEALADARQSSIDLLARHVRGDWGEFGRWDQIEVTPEQIEAGWRNEDRTPFQNKISIINQSGLVSSNYRTAKGVEVWVMTTLGPPNAQTSIMLPEEY